MARAGRGADFTGLWAVVLVSRQLGPGAGRNRSRCEVFLACAWIGPGLFIALAADHQHRPLAARALEFEHCAENPSQ
jgi:hypothetical protein